MSITTIAYTLIGIEIFPENFLEMKRKRGCKHVTYTKFCSQCGEPEWIGEDKYKEGFTADEFCIGEKFRGKWEVVGDGNYDDQRKFIGVVQEVVNEGVKMSNAPDFTAIKNELYDLLEPFGQWDDELFGMWTILYVAC